MFPLEEQSSLSDHDSSTPAALVPSVPCQQHQQTGVTETDTSKQTSGQVHKYSPAASEEDNVTDDKTLPNKTGEETSSQPINLKTGNKLVTLFPNKNAFLSFQKCL